jgi:hypothetical protein
MSCKPAEAPVVIPTSMFKSMVVKHPCFQLRQIQNCIHGQ